MVNGAPTCRPASAPAQHHNGQVLIFVRQEAHSAGGSFPRLWGTRHGWDIVACRPALPSGTARAHTATPVLVMEVQMLAFRELERNSNLRVDRVVF